MKMEIIGPLILTIISGFATLLGTIIIFFKIKRVEGIIVFCLSFSMIILLFIAFYSLIPNSYTNLINNYGIIYGTIISFLLIMLGIISIYILNDKIDSNNNLYKIGLVSTLSLILHNIPEGIIVYMSAYNNIKIGYKLVLAIIMHNIPEGMLIAIPLYYAGQSRGEVLKYSLIAALSEPLGALLSLLVLKDHINMLTISFISLFVSGLMICLSINDVFKEIKNYKENKYKYLGIILAIIFSILFMIE